jgi:hypothetical protein
LEDREELLLWIQKSLEVPSKTKPKVKNDKLSKEVLEYLLLIPK